MTYLLFIKVRPTATSVVANQCIVKTNPAEQAIHDSLSILWLPNQEYTLGITF